jgi:hypothetical protein
MVGEKPRLRREGEAEASSRGRTSKCTRKHKGAKGTTTRAHLGHPPLACVPLSHSPHSPPPSLSLSLSLTPSIPPSPPFLSLSLGGRRFAQARVRRHRPRHRHRQGRRRQVSAAAAAAAGVVGTQMPADAVRQRWPGLTGSAGWAGSGSSAIKRLLCPSFECELGRVGPTRAGPGPVRICPGRTRTGESFGHEELRPPVPSARDMGRESGRDRGPCSGLRSWYERRQ